MEKRKDFDKQKLIKIASDIRKDGISIVNLNDLKKRASDLRIATLISFIKN